MGSFTRKQERRRDPITSKKVMKANSLFTGGEEEPRD